MIANPNAADWGELAIVGVLILVAAVVYSFAHPRLDRTVA